MIVHEHGKWVLKSKDGTKTLGTHATKEEAEAQERAVEAHKHMGDSVDRVNRYDRTTIPASKRTQEGFLRIDGSKIARAGIQIYRRADGQLVKEFRDPAQVFDAASMKTFALLPLTNQHPSRPLTPSDAKQHAVGAIGEASKLDDKWLTAPISVWDSGAIAAIEAGRAQLSAGYSCQIVDEPGEWEGQRYDCKQVGIVANHLALVDVARAGPDARLRLDGNDAESGEFGDVTASVVASESDSRKTNEEIKAMAHLKIDGYTYEVTDANAQATVDRAIANAKKDGEEKFAAEKQRADNADKLRADLEKQLSALQGKYDNLTEKVKSDGNTVLKLAGQEITVVDFMDAQKRDGFMSKAIEAGVKQRAALLVEARRHLGANEKLDELSDLQIKTLVVKKLKPEAKLDGKDATYIEARYDGAIEDAKPGALTTSSNAPTGAPTVKSDDRPNNAPDARAAMINRQLRANAANGVR